MSFISDFIIATEPEAFEYSRSQAGIAGDNLLSAKNITRVELSTLLMLLEGIEWHDGLLDRFPPVGESSGLTLVASHLLNRLTDFDYDLDQIAADWAATDEMQWETDEARTLIDELAQHALRAHRLKKPIYLWNCV